MPRTKKAHRTKKGGASCCGRRRSSSPRRRCRKVKEVNEVKGLSDDDNQNEIDSFLSGIMSGSDSDDEDNTKTENPVAGKKKNKSKKRKTKKRKTKKRKTKKKKSKN